MVTIRPEEPRDIPAIAALLRSAFGGETGVKLAGVIRASPGFTRDLSLVAVREGRVVGHALLSPITIRTGSSEIPALTLAPVAVLPGYQKQGIGSLLVQEVVRLARELGHRIVNVVGEPGFYPRFGFVPARGRGLEAPFPVPDEAFMFLGLVPGALDGIGGMICYPPVFLEGLEEKKGGEPGITASPRGGPGSS